MDIAGSDKDFRQVKSNLRLVKSSSSSYVILLAVNKERYKNEVFRFHHKTLMPFDGFSSQTKLVSVGGYVYDAINDCYLVNCFDHLKLGILPFSYKLKMDETANWSVYVPTPESLILKHITAAQCHDLEAFKSSYKDADCHFQYIQFISAI